MSCLKLAAALLAVLSLADYATADGHGPCGKCIVTAVKKWVIGDACDYDPEDSVSADFCPNSVVSIGMDFCQDECDADADKMEKVGKAFCEKMEVTDGKIYWCKQKPPRST